MVPPGVDVGRAAHGQMLPGGQHRVAVVGGSAHDLEGEGVEGYVSGAIGLGRPPCRQGLDELGDRRGAVADDLGRTPHRRRHDLTVDHDDAHVVAGHARFQQHIGVHRSGPIDGSGQGARRDDPDGDAGTALPHHRLHDQLAVLGQKGEVLLLRARPLARWHRHADVGQHPAGQSLVAADEQRRRAGQLRERLEGGDGSIPRAHHQLTASRVPYLHRDPPEDGLVDDDSGVAIELVVARHARPVARGSGIALGDDAGRGLTGFGLADRGLSHRGISAKAVSSSPVRSSGRRSGPRRRIVGRRHATAWRRRPDDGATGRASAAGTVVAGPDEGAGISSSSATGSTAPASTTSHRNRPP